jgi:DNA-directed RNA polymerase specialized sigma24 family protein
MKHFFDGEVYGLTRKIKLAKKIIEEHSYRLDIAISRTDAEKEEIFRLYTINRWSIKKIARELEIERGVVGRALKEKKAKIRANN